MHIAIIRNCKKNYENVAYNKYVAQVESMISVVSAKWNDIACPKELELAGNNTVLGARTSPH